MLLYTGQYETELENWNCIERKGFLQFSAHIAQYTAVNKCCIFTSVFKNTYVYSVLMTLVLVQVIYNFETYI